MQWVPVGPPPSTCLSCWVPGKSSAQDQMPPLLWWVVLVWIYCCGWHNYNLWLRVAHSLVSGLFPEYLSQARWDGSFISHAHLTKVCLQHLTCLLGMSTASSHLPTWARCVYSFISPTYQMCLQLHLTCLPEPGGSAASHLPTRCVYSFISNAYLSQAGLQLPFFVLRAPHV